ELEAYGNGLAEKPEIVALSQADTLEPEARKKKLAALNRAAGRPRRGLPAVTHGGGGPAFRAPAAEIAGPRRREARPEAAPRGPEGEARCPEARRRPHAAGALGRHP